MRSLQYSLVTLAIVALLSLAMPLRRQCPSIPALHRSYEWTTEDQGFSRDSRLSGDWGSPDDANVGDNVCVVDVYGLGI